MIAASQVSCGIYELSGIEDYLRKWDTGSRRLSRAAKEVKHILIDKLAASERFGDSDDPITSVIFSDAKDYGWGQKLADIIKDQKMGRVIVGKPFLNRNTGNQIILFHWFLNETTEEAVKEATYEYSD